MRFLSITPIRILLSVCWLFLVAPEVKSAPAKELLLIHSYHWQLPWQQKLEKGFMDEFFRLVPQPEGRINLSIESMDQFRSKISDEQFAQYLERKYKGVIFDLVITNDAAALAFSDTYLQKISRHTPFLSFADINRIRSVKHIKDLAYITPGRIRFSDTLDLIGRLHPETEKIVVVAGLSENALRFNDVISEEMKNSPLKAGIEYWTDISLSELMERAALQSGNTVFFYLPFIIDRLGKRHVPLTVLRQLRQQTSLPIYSAWDIFIGEGIVGGKVLSADITGHLMARHAVEIIQGKAPSEIQYAPGELHSYMFDQRQLNRFDIPESRLPEGSIILHREDGFWWKYKWYITAGVLLCLIETVLIFFLMLNRAKRIRIERELRQSGHILEAKVLERTRDLTRINEKLKAGEEKFRSLSEAAFEAIAITENKIILEVNSNMTAMFGYEADEFVGMNALEIVAPEDRDNVSAKIASGYQDNYESQARRKDGSIFPVEVHARMFSYKGKEVRVTALRDITRRKAREKERERLIEELRAVIDEIKTLKGIVPICSSCKKIRDDKGYWNQLESFIEEHSDASFSHGMCPNCSEKFYGKEKWYINMKKKNSDG